MDSKKCIFDICALYNGIFLGVLASVIASILVLLFQHSKRKKDLRQRFGRAEGEYEGHEYDKNKLQPRAEIVSKASIRYEYNNVLSLKLEQLNSKNKKGENLVWVGEIIMELEQFGHLVWYYTNLDDYQHWFGFKRCIVREEKDKTYVYLIGENEEGFGKEILVRQSIQ